MYCGGWTSVFGSFSPRWKYPPIQCGEDLQCVNDGICNDGLWGANCTCIPGFTGIRWMMTCYTTHFKHRGVIGLLPHGTNVHSATICNLENLNCMCVWECKFIIFLIFLIFIFFFVLLCGTVILKYVLSNGGAGAAADGRNVIYHSICGKHFTFLSCQLKTKQSCNQTSVFEDLELLIKMTRSNPATLFLIFSSSLLFALGSKSQQRPPILLCVAGAKQRLTSVSPTPVKTALPVWIDSTCLCATVRQDSAAPPVTPMYVFLQCVLHHSCKLWSKSNFH